MRFTKVRFFLLLTLLCAGPFLGYKLWWLGHSRLTFGYYSFRGMGEAGDQVPLDYSVCWYPLGKDTIWFNGTGNLPFREGDAIPVRYQPNDPWDVRIDVFPAIWGDTLVYGGIPLFALLLMALHPRVVPRGRGVRVRWRRPFLFLD
ncbi:MAG TPA: DUF3592 domain-containing protein [Puia sp.]|jgi:hypothetical protein